MLIVSNFHDYYDCIQKEGVDKRIVYNRYEVEYNLKYNQRDRYKITYCHHHPAYVIGFCGKLYPVISVPSGRKVYSFEEYEPVIQKERGRNSGRWSTYSRSDETCKKFFNSSHDYLIEYFYKFNCPIFLWKMDKIWINTRLKRFEFQRVVNPYIAYQELSMYMGSILCENEDRIPSVSDKDMVQAKGFDKFSFRKEKGK